MYYDTVGPYTIRLRTVYGIIIFLVYHKIMRQAYAPADSTCSRPASAARP
jgi:hypothetical protein